MNWRKLLEERESDEHFVVEGQLAVERLIESDYEVLKVLRIGEDLSRQEASSLMGFHFHRGVLALARKPSPPPLEQLDGEGTLIILPEIADPGNLGTIIRNTAALGGTGVLLGKGTSPFNPKCIRASAGNLFRLPVRRAEDLKQEMTFLRSTRHLIGTSLQAKARPLATLENISRPPALMLGPEDEGLSLEFQKLCHDLIALPMDRGVDSLNVASASAIFLYELRRQLS